MVYNEHFGTTIPRCGSLIGFIDCLYEPLILAI